ncbi:hypothetical protein SC206_01050 [Rouxiella sp. T17]|uniref:hypothetical protein n=1 Tax=Rouxiella sp. T17 TaxID=3085684 RepID=UPI002FC9BC42
MKECCQKSLKNMNFQPNSALAMAVYNQGEADVILLNAANQFYLFEGQETRTALCQRPDIPHFKGSLPCRLFNVINVDPIIVNFASSAHCLKMHPQTFAVSNPKPFYNVPYLIKKLKDNAPINGFGEH